MGFLGDIAKAGVEAATAAAPAISAVSSIAGPVLQYTQQERAQEKMERAAEREQQAASRIAAEAEQNQVAQNSAMQAQQQEARKAFSQRLSNQSELLRQQLARQNLLGTPAGSGRQAEMEAQGILSADRLAADLASQGEAARQKALYALPGLAERATSVQAGLNQSNPKTALYGDLGTAASTLFGRTQQGGGFTGYRLTTPGINPNARVFKTVPTTLEPTPKKPSYFGIESFGN